MNSRKEEFTELWRSPWSCILMTGFQKCWAHTSFMEVKEFHESHKHLKNNVFCLCLWWTPNIHAELLQCRAELLQYYSVLQMALFLICRISCSISSINSINICILWMCDWVHFSLLDLFTKPSSFLKLLAESFISDSIYLHLFPRPLMCFSA